MVPGRSGGREARRDSIREVREICAESGVWLGRVGKGGGRVW